MTDTRQAKATRGNRIAVGVLVTAVSLFCFLSDVGALGGVGRMVYGFLVGFFGLASYAYSLMGVILGVAVIFGVRRRQDLSRTFYYFGLLILGIFALHIYTSSGHIIGASYGDYLLNCYRMTNTTGGMLFGIVAFPLMKVLTGVGALIVACLAFLALAGVGLIPTIRRSVTYTAVSQDEREKPKKQKREVFRRERRVVQDPVTPAREPVLTDFSHTENGTRLFVVDVDGQRAKRSKNKGADGYAPIESFDPFYPNKNGGYEDELTSPRARMQYAEPSPEPRTYAPSDPVRDILFGRGPTDENVERYEKLKNSGKLSPMQDVGSTYPTYRRQEMISKLGGENDGIISDYMNRRRAESEEKEEVSPDATDFESLKKQSLQNLRETGRLGSPMFESTAYTKPADKDKPAPEETVVRVEQEAPADEEKELAKPTRQMPRVDDQSSTVKAAVAAVGNDSVNTGMLGAVNKAKTEDTPAFVKQQRQEAPAREEAVSEAYSTPKSTTAPGAEIVRSPLSQGEAAPLNQQPLDSVRYNPTTASKLPRAFMGTATDDKDEKYERPSPRDFDKKPQNEQSEVRTMGSSGEPLPVKREVTGGNMSSAAIQSATDISHTNGREKEQNEIRARIENINKSKTEQTPLFGASNDALRGQKVKASSVRGLGAQPPQSADGGKRYQQMNIETAIDNVVKEEKKPKRPYVAPPLSLLNPPTAAVEQGEDYEAKKAQLVRTLEFFDISSSVESVQVGPTFTMYTLHVEMKKGRSVNSITQYASDIAMKMEVESVRILAPIPGKNAVGIEVPNKYRRTVNLSEVLESKQFNSAASPATFALGVDLYGESHVAQIGKLPHLLIAGATGAGKSCGINSLIVSLLYKASPDDVRFIMVDPKRVELSVYAGIPHLLMDEIICDTDKAIRALSWAEQEYERRTKFFQSLQYVNIDEYNADCKNTGYEKMPRIIVVVDEFADLMTTGKKNVEVSIGRIASLARAVGIHLVLATQRPSVDVIPGTIRNNIPARMAFKVTDSGSSKTILDTVGAESLLGMGDMLYMSTGADFKRIQGAFISNAEVKKVVEFVKANNDCDFDEKAKDEIFNDKPAEKKNDAPQKESKETRDAPDLVKALELGIELRETDGNSFTTSYIQRRLGYGYQKAARIVDTLRDGGYLGPSERDAKKVVVTMTREEFEEFKLANMGEDDEEE